VYAVGFLVVWGPVTAWRVTYYGDFWPNTYHAKSAMLSWWDQGWTYVRVYLERYWLLVAGPLLCVLGFLRAPHQPGRRETIVEVAMFVAYTAVVARVGGDFMFARLLLPVTPFLLLSLERGVALLAGDRSWVAPAATAAAVAALVLTPPSVTGTPHGMVRGIWDEREGYASFVADWAEQSDASGDRLRLAFDGLPASMCFFGAEARLAYRSRVATAIECETGLTDAFVARQPLLRRGHVGHEKTAPLSYVIERGVHFVFSLERANIKLGLDRDLPHVPVDILGVPGRLLVWDPPLVAALRKRGARIPDVPTLIDSYVARMASLPDERVASDYAKLRRFYFNRVDDAARRAPFDARLHVAKPPR
jgi:hypothetical protein